MRRATSDYYAATSQRRGYQFMLGAALVALAVAFSFTAWDLDKPIFPALVMVLIMTPILLWRHPRMALYVTFGSVCLFELFRTPFPDSLTDSVPFFWNFNTIVQTYSGKQFNAIPFNLFEVFAMTAAICSTFRNIFTKTADVFTGAVFWPILVYIVFVALGWAHGMITGGDFKIALQEVRAQFYFLIAYLMAINTVRDRQHLRTLLWTMVICIGIKGILYTFRRFVTIGAGNPIPDQGVGSHEEAFFFDCFVVWLLVIILCGVHKRMQMLMWLFLPLVLLGEVACNRRAGTAAFIIVIPVLLLAAYRAFPQRRKFVAVLGAILVIGGGAYYRAFRNSPSMIGQPARAMRTLIEPDSKDSRDQSSDDYRTAEEADLYATIKSDPIIGFGYGKRMFHAVPIADISKDYELWDVMTHNQILWVWMRVGSFGFFVFWIMMAAIIVQSCVTLRGRDTDPEIRAVSMFTLLATCMLLMFGLLDLQLSNFRDMLFVGFFTGFMASMPMMKDLAKEDESVEELPEFAQTVKEPV